MKEKDDYIFKISTKIDKKDYKKFVYITTYFKDLKRLVLFTLLILSLAVFLNIDEIDIVKKSFFTFIFFIAITIISQVIRINNKINKRIKTDKLGMFDLKTDLYFYDEEINIIDEEKKSNIYLKYSEIYKLIETKDYYLFYLNYNQASILRKRDINKKEDFNNFIKAKFQNNYKYINM